ncbi:MBOAT (membrane bound O-acyl transferase) family protein [Euphorbia peplus]|nr:MBOAT (membrane bound O-acyl transferase) family protein [Euphorbia peplus]
MESEIKKLTKVTIYILVSLSYCYSITSKISKPTFRFLSILPIITLFLILPSFLSSLNLTFLTSVFISWCANFKLLLFAFNHGPLTFPHSLPHFISIAILPIKINPNPFKTPNFKSPNFNNFKTLILPIEILLFAILVQIEDYKDTIPLQHNTVLLIYCCMACLHVDIVFGIGNALVYSILSMELYPPSDQPYFATSLQDFWGKRWNLMITNLLRNTVYKPIRRCLDGVLGKWGPAVAVVATFAVSGVMHELNFYHVTRVSPTWEVTCFFLLHGVCLAVEIAVKERVRGKWELHRVVSGPLTVGFVVVTAMWLFFPPIVRTDAAGVAIRECKDMVNAVMRLGKEMFLALW